MIAAEPAAAGSVVIALPGHEGMPARGAAGVRIGDAIEALIATKRKLGFRPAYVVRLRQYLTRFAAGRESWPLESFTVDALERWFNDRQEPPASRASSIGILGALFTFAIKRGWLTEHPCRALDHYRIDHKPPGILTPLQCHLVMDSVKRHKPGRLAFFALGLFAGVRPQELSRLTWAAVNLEDGVVVIDASAAKTRQRRVVRLEPTAIAWLRLAKEKSAQLPVSRPTRKRYLDGARTVLGLKAWPADILRHTTASNLVARHGDVGKVATLLGNSDRIIRSNYLALVSSSDCAAFWGIMPDSPPPVKPQPEPPALLKLPTKWDVTIDPTWPRFKRAEVALAAEPVLRFLGRQRQRECGYYGGVTGKRMVDADRIDTLGELGRLAGCSRQTLAWAKILVQRADDSTLAKLRSGRLSIAGAYRKLTVGADVEVHRPGPQTV